MDHFKKLRENAIRRVLATTLLAEVVLIAEWWVLSELVGLPIIIILVLLIAAAFVMAVLLAVTTTDYVLEPLRYIWQAILHVTPEHSGTAAPDLGKARLGRELITSLVLQVYQFASLETARTKEDAAHRDSVIQSSAIVHHLPLPLFVFNKQQMITNVSDSALHFCNRASADLLGKPLFEALNLSFASGEQTLEDWIKECQQNKITDSRYWQQVHVQLKDGSDEKQVDIAAYYNKDNPSGAEFIVTLFDRTLEYNKADQQLDFVAIAVHELRTPLTVLRGYIEVFEEEFSGKLNPELTDFMRKMQASAKSLTSFVNNILNVARIDQNQLVLRLEEESWPDILQHVVDDMQLRASVHEKIITCEIDNNLPTIAADRMTIYEVMANLLDNAIKYSGEQKQIVIRSKLTKDGWVETTVQDFGVGIPTAVLPNLFEKFSRSHKTQPTIGGTGLGLYLSKAIVDAHGGNIWVQSKEGEGSVFGFTLQPYAVLAEELKKGNNKDIVRQAHGWIKNHSLYRK